MVCSTRNRDHQDVLILGKFFFFFFIKTLIQIKENASIWMSMIKHFS